ncbi:MAG TPA: NADH-quinone oxidoreductase subunit J [Syntrophorhabdaceae bacterium]|nr:NADH-quinone oxidoreductase subunit J [Syntrophorhabdaceae bacterium]
MILADAVFVCVVLMTMAGALLTVLARSIIYAMMGLVLTMFGIAGLYVYLNAPFIAMMQILIYVGAVSILIAFAIMVVGPLSQKPKEWSTIARFIAGFVVAGVSFFLFASISMRSNWLPGQYSAFNITAADVGRVFFDKLMLPFELISLLIVIAIIGAIMLALFARENK